MIPRWIILLLLLTLLSAAGFGAWRWQQQNPIFEKLVDNSAAFLPDPLHGPVDQTAGQLAVAGILRATNRQREIHSLPPLRVNAQLDQAAQTKVADMFARQYFAHEAPNGVGPADLVRGVKYEYIRVGENLALGNFASDTELVQAWMDSPGHRANILHTGFSELGLAVAREDFAGTEVWLAVQTFAAPLGSCPRVDPALQQQFERSKINLDQLTDQLNSQQAQLNEAQTDMARLEEDIKKLIQASKDKVAAGNAEIEEGNRISEEEGDNEQAQSHWDRGEALQAEGKSILEEAQQKQTTLETTLADYEKNRAAFNIKVETQRKQTDAIDDVQSKLNQQIRSFNDCIK